MSRGTKFRRSQLEQLGFHQLSSGEWGKDGVQDDSPRPPTSKPKRNECSTPLAKKEDQGPGESGVRFRLIVHAFRTRLLDLSNMSVKQIEDCLTPAQGRKTYGIGIIPDDSPEFCDQPLFLQTKVKKGEERTEIEVLSYGGCV